MPGPQAAPQRGHPARRPSGWRRRSRGGCPSGRCCRSWPAPRYWLGWHRHFGPASGSDPKICRPARPVLHGRVHRRHQHRPVRGRPAHRRGVGPRAVDGPQPAHRPEEAQRRDRRPWSTPSPSWTWSRRGATAPRWPPTAPRSRPTSTTSWPRPRSGTAGVGGIAYHYISDTYVALFSRFIPCGVWEAVHLIEGLLANKSDVQPSTVHADTQGQSAPVFALAHLVRVRPDAPDPQLQGPDLLPPQRAPGLPRTSTRCSASAAATSSTGSSSSATGRT